MKYEPVLLALLIVIVRLKGVDVVVAALVFLALRLLIEVVCKDDPEEKQPAPTPQSNLRKAFPL